MTRSWDARPKGVCDGLPAAAEGWLPLCRERNVLMLNGCCGPPRRAGTSSPQGAMFILFGRLPDDAVSGPSEKRCMALQGEYAATVI